MKIQCYVLNHWFHLMCMKCHIALVYQLANQESYRHCRDVMASETTAKWTIVQQLVQANKQKTSMLHITKPLWGEVIIMMTSRSPHQKPIRRKVFPCHSNSALFSTYYFDTLILYICSLDTFYGSVSFDAGHSWDQKLRHTYWQFTYKMTSHSPEIRNITWVKWLCYEH